MGAPGLTWCSAEETVLGMIFDVEQPQEGRRESRRKRTQECLGRTARANWQSERDYRNPRTDLRAANRGALAPLGVSQQGMAEDAKALCRCCQSSEGSPLSLSELERERGNAPSEEAGGSSKRRESLEGDKKPMGVSIASNAAMQ